MKREQKILFINACVRAESRTRKLADYLLEQLPGTVTELDLQHTDLLPLNQDRLAQREKALKEGNRSHALLQYPQQFADADMIVVAAPYWDLSFPALLKAYIEAVCAVGVTFAYDEKELPYGMCRAERMIFVTTAGGPILSDEYGYGYLRMLCSTFYGIPYTDYIKAEGLDLLGADVDKILAEAREACDTLIKQLLLD